MVFKRKPDASRRRGPDAGATAVEFALVAAPLFFMIFATLEVAMIFIASTTLENAVQREARTIRTGEFQKSQGADQALNRAQFVSGVCENMSFLAARCDANTLFVDVRTPAGFTQSGAPNPIRNGAFDAGELTFQPGTQGQIVLVRAFYKWPLMTPVMTQALARVDGGSAVLQATATFRNEPF